MLGKELIFPLRILSWRWSTQRDKKWHKNASVSETAQDIRDQIAEWQLDDLTNVTVLETGFILKRCLIAKHFHGNAEIEHTVLSCNLSPFPSCIKQRVYYFLLNTRQK